MIRETRISDAQEQVPEHALARQLEGVSQYARAQQLRICVTQMSFLPILQFGRGVRLGWNNDELRISILRCGFVSWL
jgi:hypothetical protein